MSAKQKDFNAGLLAPNDIEVDTIPILLYSSLSSESFSAYGISVIAFLIHLDLLKRVFSVLNI
ncbi:hypothetical protein [Bacillus sp. EB600]|uniref:hypothetical protein n=1 Tax=Bacillus sp. EB600 TaxID=2806345 RepID=UPI00210B1336|nr:hypothetical protein [Bacillus sp. EB600]MCQ6282344.1 hypothetical protein [Bacillus sp. EB600]